MTRMIQATGDSVSPVWVLSPGRDMKAIQEIVDKAIQQKILGCDRVVYAASRGDDETGDGSKEKPFRTVSRCLSMVSGMLVAANGSAKLTVKLKPGKYTGFDICNVAVPICIESADNDADTVIIEDYNRAKLVRIEDCPKVVFKNLSFGGVDASKNGDLFGRTTGEDSNYIHLNRSHCVIEGCQTLVDRNPPKTAFYADQWSNYEFINCTFSTSHSSLTLVDWFCFVRFKDCKLVSNPRFRNLFLNRNSCYIFLDNFTGSGRGRLGWNGYFSKVAVRDDRSEGNFVNPHLNSKAPSGFTKIEGVVI